MGVISMRLSEEAEREIKKLADKKGKSISAYCKEVILSGNIVENSISRESIENEIQILQRQIVRLNNAVADLSKIILRETRINSELMLDIIYYLCEDDQDKCDKKYQRAKDSADDFIRQTFEE